MAFDHSIGVNSIEDVRSAFGAEYQLYAQEALFPKSFVYFASLYDKPFFLLAGYVGLAVLEVMVV